MGTNRNCWSIQVLDACDGQNEPSPGTPHMPEAVHLSVFYGIQVTSMRTAYERA